MERDTAGQRHYAEHWGRFVVLDQMSGGDRTKWQYLLDMGVIEFLNTMAFYKDKAEMEAQRAEENTRKVSRSWR